MAMSAGFRKVASRAGPSSPVELKFPFPAAVKMKPWGETLRTRLLSASAIYTLSEVSTATPSGWLSNPPLAGPLSPSKPLSTRPARVVMTPPGVTFRTRSLLASAMYRLLPESTATPVGPFSATSVAWPSPENDAWPFPATVVMAVPAAETLRIRLFPVSAM